MRKPGSNYRGPEGIVADNSQYAARQDTYGQQGDLYLSSPLSLSNIAAVSQSVFAVLPPVTNQIAVTRASCISLGTTAASTLTKLKTGIYVLDEGKSTLSFLPNSVITFTGISGNGAVPGTLTGVFTTPTGFTLYPDKQYFLWYYLITPASQDFYGTRAKTFTNGAGQTPVTVVDLNTRQVVSNAAYDTVPSIVFTSDRGATFYKDP